MVWRADDPQGDESGKIVWETVRYTRGQGLDLGCGGHKLWPHAIGVDNYAATAQFGASMKPDVVSSCERLSIFGSASVDWVFSSHLLEHIQDTAAALREWWRVLKPGGFLVLYLPHGDFYPKVGEPGANPDHKHNLWPADIVSHMKDVGGWDLVRNEDRNEGREYSFFQVYKKRTDGKHLYSHKDPVPEKRAAVLRYGAFGDAIQASSILPGLKEQGFHVTFYCTPRTHDVLKHDPHIDDFYIQDTDQVPNQRLGEFWGHEKKKYERFINLSESIEGTLLALPGRPNHAWPINLRRKMMGTVNYMQLAHDLAGVPMPPKPKFYATPEELAWAKKERAKFGGDMLVMYSLAGSSVHKVWPWQDHFFARLLLEYPTARIVTVGDDLSEMLEMGWEKEPRVICKSGKYTIRESMALLSVCDVVVGPETGILNAAAHMPMPKLVMLSHSSVENLTRYWVNTTSLEPTAHCYPCHQMHYSFEHCNRDEESGTALCQSSIGVDQAWQAFKATQLKAA